MKASELKINSHYLISSRKMGFSELPCFIQNYHEHKLSILVLENDEGTIELTKVNVEETEVENSVFFEEIPPIVLEALKDKEKHFIKQNLVLARNLSDLNKFLG